MSGTVGLRGMTMDIPDCLSCNKSLKFDYMGKIVDYVYGRKTVLVCNNCKKRFVCLKGKVLEELKL